VNRPADTQLADTKEVADSRRAAETLGAPGMVSLPNCPNIGPVDIGPVDIGPGIALAGHGPAVRRPMLVVSALAMDRSVHCQSRIHPNADLGLVLGRTRHLIKR
jgi:hypothetical protein